MYMLKWVEIEPNLVIPNISRKRTVDVGRERESPRYAWGEKKERGLEAQYFDRKLLIFIDNQVKCVGNLAHKTINEGKFGLKPLEIPSKFDVKEMIVLAGEFELTHQCSHPTQVLSPY